MSGTRLSSSLWQFESDKSTLLFTQISTETAEITLYKEEISTLKKQLEEQVALGTGLAWKQVSFLPPLYPHSDEPSRFIDSFERLQADMEQRAEDWDRERRELQDRLAKAFVPLFLLPSQLT